MKKLLFITMLVLPIFFIACDDDDDNPTTTALGGNCTWRSVTVIPDSPGNDTTLPGNCTVSGDTVTFTGGNAVVTISKSGRATLGLDGGAAEGFDGSTDVSDEEKTWEWTQSGTGQVSSRNIIQFN